MSAVLQISRHLARGPLPAHWGWGGIELTIDAPGGAATCLASPGAWHTTPRHPSAVADIAPTRHCLACFFKSFYCIFPPKTGDHCSLVTTRDSGIISKKATARPVKVLNSVSIAAEIAESYWPATATG